MKAKGNNFMENFKSQKGSAVVLLAMLILAIILIIGTGISLIMISQVKMSTDSGQSVLAFYAAGSGAELCLYQLRKSTGTGCDTESANPKIPLTQLTTPLVGPAQYEVYHTIENISGTNYSFIRSLGQYGKTNRRVQFSWPE